jgi:hypothetical protein
MPSSGHQAYREFVRQWSEENRSHAERVAALERHAEAAQVLWALDLEPARPILMQGYAENPRGSKPRDPVIVLRSLLLSVLVGQVSINKWAKDLRGSRVLQVLSGIGLDGREGTPGVGTFYDFMHRLHDGPHRRPCFHIERPSDDERRRAVSPKTRQRPKADDRKSASSKEGRKRLGAKRPSSSVTAQLCSALTEQQLQPNANDLLGRLSELLMEVAVKISAAKGLLGDLANLSASGDGSPVQTGGSRHGRRVCSCPKHKRCDCPRRYSDPDANVGWDSHRERFFYGHHLYEIVAPSNKHDLPLALRLDPASTSDFLALPMTLEHLRKTLRDKNLAKLSAVMLDAGHDGDAIYRFLLHHNMLPVIPLKQPAPAFHPTRNDLRLSRRGVPLCGAGAEMALSSTHGKKSVVYACPVKVGVLDVCPKAPADFPQYRCRPLDKLAPTVTINVEKNARLCPPLPRNHKRFKKLYKLRSGSERSFALKKHRFQLEKARHRRKSFWLIRVHLMAVLQHATAWVAKQDPLSFIHSLITGGDRIAA